MTSALLQVDDVRVVHGHGRHAITALHPTTLTVDAGDSVAIIGRSGAGKTTLAEVILGLREPTAGEVRLDGVRWNGPRRRPPRALRRLVQGVPQDAAVTLPPRATVRASIARALAHLDPQAPLTERIAEAADAARLPRELLDRTPRQLSGGQAQRAAIARALAVRPRLLVADEPSSALDHSTGAEIADVLCELTETGRMALIVVTHDDDLAARCRRIVRVTDGVLSEASSV